MRELFHSDSGCDVVPIGVKKNVAQQKFRIPFKNLSTTLDADFDFTFVKMSPSVPSNTPDEDLQDVTHLLEFFCQPASMKFSPTQQQFLNVLIKVNTVKMATLEDSLPRKKYNQLM